MQSQSITSVRNRRPIEERFWEKVNKTETCWLWTAQLDKEGYGQFRILCKGRRYQAHRISWRLHFGEIPEGMKACHHCDNPACVRPSHLFLGTQTHNVADMNAKGRHAFGEKNGSAKMTNEQVRDIRRRYAAGGVLQHTLAVEHGVADCTISQIVNRKKWPRIT